MSLIKWAVDKTAVYVRTPEDLFFSLRIWINGQTERERTKCEILPNKKDGKTNRKKKKTEKIERKLLHVAKEKAKSNIDLVLIQFKGGKLCVIGIFQHLVHFSLNANSFIFSINYIQMIIRYCDNITSL